MEVLVYYQIYCVLSPSTTSWKVYFNAKQLSKLRKFPHSFFPHAQLHYKEQISSPNFHYYFLFMLVIRFRSCLVQGTVKTRGCQ